MPEPMRPPGEWPRNRKLALLAVSLWPVVYGAAFVVIGLPLLEQIVATNSLPPSKGVWVGGLFVLYFVTLLVTLALLVLYLTDVLRNPRHTTRARVLWVIALFVGIGFVFPAYWYFSLWRVPRRREPIG